MKKTKLLVATLLIVCSLFALVACNNNGADGDGSGENGGVGQYATCGPVTREVWESAFSQEELQKLTSGIVRYMDWSQGENADGGFEGMIATYVFQENADLCEGGELLSYDGSTGEYEVADEVVEKFIVQHTAEGYFQYDFEGANITKTGPFEEAPWGGDMQVYVDEYMMPGNELGLVFGEMYDEFVYNETRHVYEFAFDEIACIRVYFENNKLAQFAFGPSKEVGGTAMEFQFLWVDDIVIPQV